MDSVELFKIWTLPPDIQTQGEDLRSYIDIGAESYGLSKPVSITIGANNFGSIT